MQFWRKLEYEVTILFKWNVTVNRVNTVNGETYPTTHESISADQIDFENVPSISENLDKESNSDLYNSDGETILSGEKNMVKNSKIVISKGSTAIIYAIIFKKPLIFALMYFWGFIREYLTPACAAK